ncbi:MAG: LysE family translocator [Desulfobacteraceae bacterium]|nr:MAG: LysE family translocator [Desulfobacteraceae bacterium]
MYHIQNYGSFILAVIAFQIIPGAGTITILNATARKGICGGMKSVLGTLSGDFIYMLSAVLGLSAILSAYPSILKGAQWIGVAYLCWMGLKLLWSSEKNGLADIYPNKKNWAYFRQGIAVSLTNPKTIMFFMAFFPLFLSSESTPITLLLLMGHVTIISFIYQTFLVLAGNAVTQKLTKWKLVSMVAKRLTGIAFIAFGLKLAFNNK